MQSNEDWDPYRTIPKQRIEHFVIRAFRPIEDKESAERFAQGHAEVLTTFGFKLSSANTDWMTDPKCYAVIVESPDRSATYGGARFQENNSITPLPVIDAIDVEAPEIVEFVASKSEVRLAEICGLWNSISIAGMGVGSVYSIRAIIAIAGMIGVKEMIALCSVHTYRAAHKYGFTLLESVGNKGEIPYVGAKQIARLTYQQDILKLPGSDKAELEVIQQLRASPVMRSIDNVRGGNVLIDYILNV